jgi:hypothetical protein
VTACANAEDFIVREWEAALADAGVSPRDYHLITCPGAIVQGYPKAVCYEPGGKRVADGFLYGAQLDEANAARNINRHRIAVFEDVDSDDALELALLAGMLRHEIQHGIQRELCPDAFALQEITEHVITCKVGEDATAQAAYHNFAPMEDDCNAAASMFLRGRHPMAVPQILESRDAALARSWVPPGRSETLVVRTVAFLYLFSDVCEDPGLLGAHSSFAGVLVAKLPGSGAIWSALRANEQ